MIFPQLMPFTSTSSSRVLETDGEDMQNRERSCFFSAAHAAKDSGIALEDLGELDKSGIAELTFKDHHKHSANRV